MMFTSLKPVSSSLGSFFETFLELTFQDELERRVHLLEDELTEKQRNVDRQEADIEDLRRKHQLEVDRLKAEMANLQTKYQNDLDDERDQNSHVCFVL